jgi:putative ABC transport system permease protein
MEWLSALRIGLTGLAVHKIRAALSMLGIIFGVASVVAVIAVSEGAKAEMLKQLAALGANNIIVRGIDWRSTGAEMRDKKKRARLLSRGLTVREAQAIFDETDLFLDFAALTRTGAGVRRDEKPVQAQVFGTSIDFIRVMDFKLREGRWFHPQDEEEGRRVCVIEETVAGESFPLTSPVGHTLVIDHEPYTVVGVLRGKEETEEKYTVVDIAQLNRRVYIPMAAALYRTTREPLADEVSEVIFRCRDAAGIPVAAALLNRFYETSHGMSKIQDEDRDYQVLVAKELLGKIEEAQKIFNIVMLCSAGISLVVGGIGIMNIMLANVSERRREVGIRRAVGATQGDILRQFLLESLIICLFGGILGCVLGVVFTYGVHQITGWQTAMPLWGMFAAVSVSLLDGVAFGTYPAWQAAQLDPIEALQYE